MNKLSGTQNPFHIVVVVAALGYFVDIYDLILFSIVRVPSLRDIGIHEDQLKASGIFLIQMQMAGMIAGGIVWGILGDKRGRLSVLFFTILLYSLANLANGFVHTFQQYAWLRVIAGFGLAGELGIGITLVSEVMSKESRAIGTSLVSGVGIAGAALAFAFAEWGWKQAYWAGGLLGLLLLGFRVYVQESGMFEKIKKEAGKRGDFFCFFTDKERFRKYISCILIGIPVWFVIGILVTFSKEFAEYLGLGTVNVGKGVMIHYMGAACGSLLTGWLSQVLHSRKKAIACALITLTLVTAGYFSAFGVSLNVFYFILFILGISQGYWAVFITVAAEQFGTNIRSTATTTIPNFVRGSTVLMTFFWGELSPSHGILKAALAIGLVVVVLAFLGLYNLRETYGKELDYTE